MRITHFQVIGRFLSQGEMNRLPGFIYGFIGTDPDIQIGIAISNRVVLRVVVIFT